MKAKISKLLFQSESYYAFTKKSHFRASENLQLAEVVHQLQKTIICFFVGFSFQISNQNLVLRIGTCHNQISSLKWVARVTCLPDLREGKYFLIALFQSESYSKNFRKTFTRSITRNYRFSCIEKSYLKELKMVKLFTNCGNDDL